MKDNPELGDRGCAALEKCRPHPYFISIGFSKVRLRAADGLRAGRRAVLPVFCRETNSIGLT